MKPPNASRLGPLRHRWFTILWLASLGSNIGSWMNEVGAAWFMTSLTDSPFWISLVQAATTLPFFLFALPAGALSDLVDRRRYLLVAQVMLFFVAAALALFTAFGLVQPVTLLLFVFLLGAGNACVAPAWQALVPTLVPREDLPSAVTLNGININLARAIGPAVGGALLATAGPAWVFALNGISFCFIAVCLWRWPAPVRTNRTAPEQLGAAIVSGMRYVGFSPPFRRLLWRIGSFMLGAAGLWALLPLLAREQLGLTALGYGVLMGCLGAGAVTAALFLTALRRRLSGQILLVAGTIIFAGSTALLSVARLPLIAMGAVFVAGAAWLALLASYNTLAQSLLPDWVRGRALSLYLVVFFGGMSLGSILWGAVASVVGLGPTLAAAAALQLVGLAVTARLTVAVPRAECSEPAVVWAEHNWRTVAEPSQAVLVEKTYRVDPTARREFLKHSLALRDLRRRGGAMEWRLFSVPEAPDEFVEVFSHASFGHHQRSHERLSREDEEILKKIENTLQKGTSSQARHLFQVSIPSAPKNKV